jgi:hypothetical protein
MINFVVKENKTQNSVGQIRKMVTVSTTLVLVIYVVIAGGMAGWTFWVSAHEKQTSEESDNLAAQIRNLNDSEVIARNLDARAGMVEDFLTNRGNASDAANVVIKDGYTVVGWIYSAGGSETVSVAAASPTLLQEYADYQSANYSKVQTQKIEWLPDSGWTGTFILTGRKKT